VGSCGQLRAALGSRAMSGARWAATRWAALASALTTAACSLALDLGREQCESHAQCSERGFENALCIDRICQQPAVTTGGTGGTGATGGVTGNGGTGGVGGALDPEWACLPDFETPVPPTGELISYRFRFEKATQANVPPPDTTLRLCGILDSDCLNPIPNTPQPDADGRVQLDLAPNFEGYLEVEGAQQRGVMGTELKPTLVFLPSVVLLPPNEEVIRVVTVNEFAALVAASGEVYDPLKGFSVMLAKNCMDERAPGVKFVTDKGDATTQTYYFNGQLPDFDALLTDEQGAGGFNSLPVGFITSEARLADTDQYIGKAGFLSRANHLSYVPIGPTP
jgi:hypothetical protein